MDSSPKVRARKKPSWSVLVTGSKDYGYRAMFRVGCQYFELARVNYDRRAPGFKSSEIKEARQHCEFIKRMFLKALANLGIQEKRKPGSSR